MSWSRRPPHQAGERRRLGTGFTMIRPFRAPIVGAIRSPLALAGDKRLTANARSRSARITASKLALRARLCAERLGRRYPAHAVISQHSRLQP
jgi:hypothetical protein